MILSCSPAFPAAAEDPPPPAPDKAEAAPAAPAAKEKTTRWIFSWGGWDGLRLGVVRKTPLKTPEKAWALSPEVPGARPLIDIEEVKLTSTIGVKVAGDGAAFGTTGNLTGFDDGFELRRARISARGEWVLVVPILYSLEFGYSPNTFVLNDAWLLLPALRYVGSMQIGQFQPPQGLDVINSSWAITFMEPAAPLQALAPGTEAGIQIGQPVLDKRATWCLGLFASGAGNNEYGTVSKDYGSVIGRVTWLPIWEPAPGASAEPRLLHVGLSANVLVSASDVVRYQSRPESYIAPYVIDTGTLFARSATTLGVEAAWVNGPFSLQAEYLRSFVNPTEGSTLKFGGYYVIASWFLTGESRPYDPATATFGRPSPRQDFRWKEKTWGAFEVACRWSYTNLTDHDVQGGRLGILMGGLNWYLQPHIRWYVNAGWGHVTGTSQAGDMGIFQVRLAVFM